MLRRLAVAVTLVVVAAVPMTQASALPSDCAYGTPLDCDCNSATPCMGVSAPNAQLRGKNLRGVNLTGANLRGADLRRANLSGAILTRVNLAGAKLDGANFSKARILGATLTGVSAVRTNWKGAIFGRATRPGKRANSGATYVDTTLSGNHCGGNFSAATLTNVTASGDFSYASCGTAATFQNSTQRSNAFSQANLTGVNLSYVVVNNNLYLSTALTGTNWHETTGSGSNFTSATFGTDSQGYGNNFSGIYMTRCTCPNGQIGNFDNGPCQ